MDAVSEVSFGPSFDKFRRQRFRLYRRLWTPVGVRLDEWETDYRCTFRCTLTAESGRGDGIRTSDPLRPRGPLCDFLRTVRLEPLTVDHIPALAAVAFDPDLWRWTTTRLETEADLRTYVDDALALQRDGTCLPFCTFAKDSNTAGSSRFGNYDAANRKVEIGWTWVARPGQRTSVNAEAKLLMLQHAFEELECLRVEFKTDRLNVRSQGALEKLGAVRERVLRSHMIAQGGRRRDSVYFSILAEEWPQVRRGLENASTAGR
jgi:RimJ/RimL family protein N-acetyltransferase